MPDAHRKVAVNRKVVPLQNIANQTGDYQSSLRGGRVLVFVARFQRDSRIGTHLCPLQKRFLALAETSSIAMPSSASSASTSSRLPRPSCSTTKSGLTPSLDRVLLSPRRVPRRAFRAARALGRKRAAFWRALGFPNLVKAREVSARNRRSRKQVRLFTEAKLRNPFALEKTPRRF